MEASELFIAQRAINRRPPRFPGASPIPKRGRSSPHKVERYMVFRVGIMPTLIPGSPAVLARPSP